MTILDLALLALAVWLYLAGRWLFSRSPAVEYAFEQRPGHPFSEQVFLASWPLVVMSYGIMRIIFAISPERRRRFAERAEGGRQPSPTKWV